MNKSPLLILMLFISVVSFGQNCDGSYNHLTASFVAPKGLSVEMGMVKESGFTTGIGVGYQYPKRYKVKSGEEITDSIGNVLDIYTYFGYRIFRRDYKVSVYANGGIVMGDVQEFAPVVSLEVVIPAGYKAFSIEPFYIVGRGFSSRFSILLKI